MSTVISNQLNWEPEKKWFSVNKADLRYSPDFNKHSKMYKISSVNAGRTVTFAKQRFGGKILHKNRQNPLCAGTYIDDFGEVLYEVFEPIDINCDINLKKLRFIIYYGHE